MGFARLAAEKIIRSGRRVYKNMKVALVHDYLKDYGGAEKVLEVLYEMFPEAPIYVIFSKVEKNGHDLLSQRFSDAKIVETWFGRLPFCERLISPSRFLIPWIWGAFNFSDFDLVVSSASWAVTKGFAIGATKEICYCHTPPRYLYGYETSRDMKKNVLVRIYALLVNHFMRMYDFSQAQKVTQFIANSEEVARRIKKFYRRDSVVINPPVEVSVIMSTFDTLSVNSAKDPEGNLKDGWDSSPLAQNDGKESSYFLTGGRLAQQKNFDVIIRACNELGLPLKVYGTGPMEESLKRMAGPTIGFVGFVSDGEKNELIAGCKAFIVAATDEDFGITPVEAGALGKPVIAYRGGGYLETVVDGKTGVFFNDLSVEALVGVLQNFDGEKYKKEDCLEQAKKFSKERFERELRAVIKGIGF